ncbi:hypothetical protein BDQ17DRAFT_1334844 [Cyathus striatus]|nr:hypothetical protein BDQ17DRAFT_1334844 [Cyathus striatus]
MRGLMTVNKQLPVQHTVGYMSTPVPHETLVEDHMCHNLQAPSVGEIHTDNNNNPDVRGLMPVDKQSPVITKPQMHPIDQGMTSDFTLMPVTQESPVDENHMCDNVQTPLVGENPIDYDNNPNIADLMLVNEQPPVITELHMNIDQGMAHKLMFPVILDVQGFILVDEQPLAIIDLLMNINQGMAHKLLFSGILDVRDSTSTHVSHEPPIEEDYKDTALDINGIPTLLETISEGMESACGHSLSKPTDQLTMPRGVQMCMPTPLGSLFYTFPTLPPMGDYNLPKPTGEGMILAPISLSPFQIRILHWISMGYKCVLQLHWNITCQLMVMRTAGYTFSTVPTMMDYSLPKLIEEGVILDDRDLWTFEDEKSSSIKCYVDIDSMQEQLTDVTSDLLVRSFSGNPTQTPDVPSPDALSPWTSFLQSKTKIFLELQVPLSNHADKTKYIYRQSLISSRKKYESNVKKDDNENNDMEKAVENQSCLFIAPDMEKSQTKLPFSQSDGICTEGRKFKLKDNIEGSAKPTANGVDMFMKNGPHAPSNATCKMGYNGSHTLAALGYTDCLIVLECLMTDFGNTTCIKHRHEHHSKQDSSVTLGKFHVDGVSGPHTISKSKVTNNKNRSRIYNLENADFLDCGCTVESALTELLWINTWNVRDQMITEPIIPPKDLFGFQHHDIVAQNIQKETLLNIDDYYTSNINIMFDQDEERRRMLMVTHNIACLNELGKKNNCSH